MLTLTVATGIISDPTPAPEGGPLHLTLYSCLISYLLQTQREKFLAMMNAQKHSVTQIVQNTHPGTLAYT